MNLMCIKTKIGKFSLGRVQKFFAVLLLLSVVSLGSAQTIKELEAQRKEAMKRLETTNKVLNETKKTQKSSLNRLNIIKRSISQRQNLINSIDREINALNREIANLNREKNRLEQQLEQHKADYAHMVRESFINRSTYSRMLFLLSAETFNQSYRRLRYMQELSNYRKDQIRKIEETQKEIEEKAALLEQHKRTQEDIRKDKASEQSKLQSDQKQENTVYANLKNKEKSLQADLRKQQKIANDLNKKIETLIAEEIRKQQEKALREQGIDPSKASQEDLRAYTLTKEQKLIAGNFVANKGRLPWPVDRGFISGKYGVQPHPTLKHVTTNNKGIYIQTPARTKARAVFDGEVTQRFSVPGSNNIVIIQHGQYRTVYANLTSINVVVGQKVKAKQTIGSIYTDKEDDNKTELFFQVWENSKILNPEHWLSK